MEGGNGVSVSERNYAFADRRTKPGCEAARAVGQGYFSEKAIFSATHLQSGTDLVGARRPGKSHAEMRRRGGSSRSFKNFFAIFAIFAA